MTIPEIIQQYPWLAEFKDNLREKCHDCAVTIGELHKPGCDAAVCPKCKGQHMVCGCKSPPDQYIGIMYPDLHKACLEHNLWCYDAILHKDGTKTPITNLTSELLTLHMKDEIKIQWHIPCHKEQPGSHADLNKAAFHVRKKK